MEKLVPEIRLKSGKLIFESGLELPFITGLVFNDGGNYYFELHFDEALDLDKFYEENKKEFLSNDPCSIFCKTNESYELEATGISMKTLPSWQYQGDFYCFGYLKIEKKKYDTLQDKDEEPRSVENPVHYVILEGLKMHHCEHTLYKAQRYDRELDDAELKQGHWDHTTVAFNLDDYWYKFNLKENGENTTILEFESPYAQYLSISFEKWEEIKIDFLEFLSFFNGAQVNVRAEYSGDYYTVGKPDAQISHIYSFKKEVPRSHNDYLPIQKAEFRGDNILGKAFLKDFQYYRTINEKLGLNTTIFYLNGSQQASSVPERLMLQTIILEMLSDKYADTLEGDSTTLIDNTKFEPIKNELIEVLKTHKKDLGKYYNDMQSRLTNINNTKRKNTDFKFRQLLIGVGITITEQIEQLLIARHSIIHRGDIGHPDIGMKHYFLMDRLIRAIIVKLIGYTGPTIETNKYVELRTGVKPNKVDE